MEDVAISHHKAASRSEWFGRRMAKTFERRDWALWPWLAAGLLLGHPTIASATVLIEGTRAELRVVTEHEPIKDVLAAVSTTLNVKVRSSIPLDVAANKIYVGSLTNVISQLLNGYNYVVRHEQGASEIIVFGKRGDAPVAAEAAKAAAPKGIVSRWR